MAPLMPPSLLFTSHPPHIWLQSEIVHAMKSEMIAKYPNSREFLQP